MLATTAAFLAHAAVLAGPASESGAASWVGVAILGVVQGLTEFLPVSSSGHLALASALLERSAYRVPEAGLALNTVLHVGTLVAVAAIFGKDLLALGLDTLRGRPRDLLLVLLGSLPAGVVGILFKSRIEEFTADPNIAAVCLLVTAVFLVVGELARRRTESRHQLAALPHIGHTLTARDAFVVGCVQAIAILPGISRSGSTIAAGLLCGLDVRAAARFSFLLGFFAIAGAAALEIPEALHDANASPARMLIGLALSAVVGVLSLRLLLVAIGKGAFRWFAVYCAAVGTTWLLLFDA